MHKEVLICIDRDGTLIYDDKYYLGRTNDWKSKIKILPKVIAGLKLLQSQLPDSKIFMITNQPGIAIKEFPLLTKKRDREVNQYLLNLFSKKGIIFDGFFFSPFASKEYALKHSQYHFKPKYTKDSQLTKPNPGMVFQALKASKFLKKLTNIYVIGDRKLDGLTGLNAKATGIVIPFKNTLDKSIFEEARKHKNFIIKKDFVQAAKFIISREKD
ncbi:MAG: hypothetical protein AABX11_01440 [Nanoarchaeota archaeon]